VLGLGPKLCVELQRRNQNGSLMSQHCEKNLFRPRDMSHSAQYCDRKYANLLMLQEQVLPVKPGGRSSLLRRSGVVSVFLRRCRSYSSSESVTMEDSSPGPARGAVPEGTGTLRVQGFRLTGPCIKEEKECF
jgi:hypothetical protein